MCHGNSESSGSEIASCNYVARSYGVTKGMWMRNAKQLCPHLCTLPYDFEVVDVLLNTVSFCVLFLCVVVGHRESKFSDV